MTKLRIAKSDSSISIPSILTRLNAIARPEVIEYNRRVGLGEAKSLGIPTPELKRLSSEIKKTAADRHILAAELWSTGSYDARAIAFMIDDPRMVTIKQMEDWVSDFDNWATVDGTCCYLFCRTPFAYQKAFEWAERTREFEKRAGFSMMACLAVHDKKADDQTMAAFFPITEQHAWDERNFVKKAVSWAIRQIGKRNLQLNNLAIETARRIRQQDTNSAKWMAADALRELESPKIRTRLMVKEDRYAARA